MRAIANLLTPVLLSILLYSCGNGNKDSQEITGEIESGLLNDFIIMAYSGPPLEQVTLERYQEIAEAGIDYLVPGNGTFNLEQNLKALDLSEKVGIKIIPLDMRLLPFALKSEIEIEASLIGSIVRDYKEHPAFGAYFIKDEPGVKMFPALKEISDIIRMEDREHESLSCLFPSYGTLTQFGVEDYRSYIRSFIETVKPGLLAYDSYSLRKDRTIYKEWFSNLSIVREETLKADIPYLVYVQSLGIVEGLRVPNRAEILWQINTALSYGAQGIGWFSYWTPNPGMGLPHARGAAPPIIEHYHNAMIDINGNRTEIYDYVKEANLYMNKAGRGLLAWENSDVARFEAGKMIAGGSSPVVTPVGDDAHIVVGTFRKDNCIRLVVSNSSCEEPTSFALNVSSNWELDKVFTSIDANSAGKGGSLLEWSLKPGGSVVIDLKKDVNFVADEEIRDVSWFLKRMRSVDHLPIIENSHTAMVSTWDKNGENDDHWTHDKIDGKSNTIVDINGPGCLHRIFTGLTCLSLNFSMTNTARFLTRWFL